VHAYVGEEVIVTWPVADILRATRAASRASFAIEHRWLGFGPDYERDFDIVPAFRAGLHAGSVVISECGDAKRQLAYFGDTMNVAARFCEHCKTIDERPMISGELKRLLTIPDNWVAGESRFVGTRGRQELV
jgi:adenylate cyclase